MSRGESTVEVRSGALRATVDLTSGCVWDISLGDIPLIYQVYPAVRDENWKTPVPAVTVLTGKPGTSVQLSADYSGGVDYEWTAEIVAVPGSISYTFEGRARARFKRNRIGLCLLLFASHAGAPVTVVHSDGSQTTGHLPETIAPHQPFTDISELVLSTHGRSISIAFEGEVFEMEDQRNWTDCSYKIYGTPLDLPFPVQVETGERVRQQVTIAVDPDPAHRASEQRPEHQRRRHRTAPGQPPGRLAGGSVPCKLPRIGTRITRPLSDEDRSLLDAIQPAYLRLDVPDGAGLVEQVESRIPENGPDVDVFVWTTANGRDQTQVGIVRELPGVRSVVLVDRVRGITLPESDYVGTAGAFAELNRTRPDTGGRAVMFTVSPQVHASDVRTVMDNIIGLRHAFASVRDIYPGIPIHLAAVDLIPFFEAAIDGGRGPTHHPADSRQRGPLARAYAFGVICEAAAAGVEEVTLFALAGSHGFGDAGVLFPCADVLTDIAVFGDDSLEVVLPQPEESGARSHALVGRGPGRTTIIAANTGLVPADVAPIPGSGIGLLQPLEYVKKYGG